MPAGLRHGGPSAETSWPAPHQRYRSES
jgi:hypothetical protein